MSTHIRKVPQARAKPSTYLNPALSLQPGPGRGRMEGNSLCSPAKARPRGRVGEGDAWAKGADSLDRKKQTNQPVKIIIQ